MKREGRKGLEGGWKEERRDGRGKERKEGMEEGGKGEK